MCGATLIAFGISNQARADDNSAFWGPGYWRLAGAPLTVHFRYSAEHVNAVAVAVERQRTDGWLAGASLFRNSFGQPSSYTYVGKQYPELLGVPELVGQVSGGILYGYRGKYAKKVPLNVNGFAPGALVGLGWQFNRETAVTAHLLGDAGVMFQFSLNLR